MSAISRRVVTLGVVAALATPALTACSGSAKSDPGSPLVVSASSVPHAQILKEVEKRGLLGQYKLDVKEVTGDVDPNQLLEAGDVDVNFFQHKPYEQSWSKDHNVTNLVDVATVHVEPLGLYSSKVKNPAQLPDGATIALPNNVTNFARGLYLLESAKLITLKEPDVAKADVTQVTDKDVVNNPKHLKFIQVDAPQLPRTLSDGKVDAAVINGNYALEAKLTPSKDAIALEQVKGNPFANVLTTVSDKKDDPRVQALAKALQSKEIATWINDTYHGSVVAVAGS